MWRKTTEAKPNPPASKAPAAVPEKPRDTPQANAQQAAAVPEPAKTTTAETAVRAETPAPAAVKSALAASPAPAAAPARTPAVAEASTISAGLKIKGEITGTSDLTIDGETQGKVRLTNGRVTVGASGRVIADIDAREIVVNGTVQGNLKAGDSVRIGPSGRVEGSILTARFGIDDGARLRGNVEMIRPGEGQEASRRERPETAQTARAASASVTQE